MSLPKLNPVEPPWYGPVCPVVGEGWHREVSPYPDQNDQKALAADRKATAAVRAGEANLDAANYKQQLAVIDTEIGETQASLAMA